MRLKIKKIIKRIKIFGFSGTLKYILNRFSYFLLKDVLKKRLVVKKIHGSKMVLDLKNTGISQALWVDGTREELDVEVVKNELKSGMNVLEVGANIGYYLLLEGKILNGEGEIFAFEPDPRNLELLKLNIKKNNLVNFVKLYPFAVSDQNSQKNFFLAKLSNLSTLAPIDKKSGEFIKVRTIKIDEFKDIDVPINFIRMDIEGYEYEAISGMMQMLNKNDNIKLLVELHPQYYKDGRDFTKVVSSLFSQGFYVKYIISAGHYFPERIKAYGYQPVKISREMVHSRGLYENIKKEHFIKLIKNSKKIIRSVLLVKDEK